MRDSLIVRVPCLHPVINLCFYGELPKSGILKQVLIPLNYSFVTTGHNHITTSGKLDLP